MKQSKQLYSQNFQEYKLTDKQLGELHAHLSRALWSIDKLCREGDINYSLCGGTLLGAVRHKGFIPWDDDIDLMMTRSEYGKFKKAFNGANNKNYFLAEPGDNNYYNKMPKLFIKGTTYDEITTAGADGHHELFIDIFIIENMPKSKISRKVKGLLYLIAHRGSSVCIDYLYPSPPILEKAEQNEEVREYYNLRRRLGWVFSHIGGMKFWLRLCERLARYEKRTGLLGIPSGISYNREVFPANILTETVDMEFCGHKVQALKHYDEYLTNLYGANYMQIPPKEKREVHSAYRVEL